MSKVMRGLAAVCVATAIGGCGGGGGDAPAPVTSPAPTSATPLALDRSSAPVVAGMAPAVGEAILTVAQFAADSVRRFALAGASTPIREACPNGGLLTVTLLDRDGNGVASAGDRVSVRARDCAVPVITDVVNGSFDIDLGSAAGLAPGSYRGTIALGSGLTFGAAAAGAASVGMVGSMQFDWTSTDLRTALRTSSTPADDLRLTATRGAQTLTESIRQFDLSKAQNYDEARAAVSMAFRYDSETLAGSFTVSTPEPLLAYLNTYPEAGRIELRGAAGSRVVLTPNFVTNSHEYNAALDANGDGTAEASFALEWSSNTLGYLWWDATSPLQWSSTVFIPRTFSATDFGAALNFNWTTAGATAFRLQFSRPLAATAPTLHMRFADQGGAQADALPLLYIDANVERHGALVLARPAQPLRHGRIYALQVSIDGNRWFDTVTLQDTLGNSTMSFQWAGLTITTPDGLLARPVVDPGVLLGAADRLHLNASGSIGSPRAIVSHHWSQLSGTPLRIDTAGAAQADVSWGATPPHGVESALLQLTVTDAAGDTDSKQFVVQAADLGSSRHVLYFRSAAGDYIGAGRTVLLGDSSGRFDEGSPDARRVVLTFWDSSSGSVDYFWGLSLGSFDAATLSLGAHEGSTRFATASPSNFLDVYGDGRGCNQTFGRFDVLEAQTDAAGNFVKLAVDFEQHCESSGSPPLLGSYRINSSVPIRR